MGQPAGRGETAVGAEMTRPTGRKDTHPKQQQEGQKAGRGKVMFTQNPKGRDEAFKRNILQSGSMGYDDSQAPDVDSRAAVLLALDNLRSREFRSPAQLAQISRERRGDACQPKIGNLDIRGFIHQNVLWLQISPLIELTNIQAVIVDCNVAGAIGIITCLGILSEPHDPERPPAHHPPQVVPPNPFELGSSHINQAFCRATALLRTRLLCLQALRNAGIKEGLGQPGSGALSPFTAS
ncbi:MAG: hypothetical protein FRX49_03667 [Trebouxia sp. A1-2]|nr:MAG: hypothetical protein FRX49_03667 [Trebouxia sp. A1-2]